MEKSEHFKLTKDKRAQLIGDIRLFFQTERDEEIGELAAGTVLDFMLEKLGIELYNQGVTDSYSYLNDKIVDVLGIRK